MARRGGMSAWGSKKQAYGLLVTSIHWTGGHCVELQGGLLAGCGLEAEGVLWQQRGGLHSLHLQKRTKFRPYRTKEQTTVGTEGTTLNRVPDRMKLRREYLQKKGRAYAR